LSPGPAPIVTEAPVLEREFQPVDGLVPLGDICDFLGFELELSGENSALIEGRPLEYLPEDGVLCFDGRWLYAPEGFSLREGELWLETEAAKKILGLWQYEDVLIEYLGASSVYSGGETCSWHAEYQESHTVENTLIPDALMLLAQAQNQLITMDVYSYEYSNLQSAITNLQYVISQPNPSQSDVAMAMAMVTQAMSQGW